MPSTTKRSLDRASVFSSVGAGGEPVGEPRVLGTDVEIGGVGPDLEP
jgi:hypothetical protein